MGIQESYLRLVEQAMSGQSAALNQLAEAIRDPLRSYVLRVIFKTDITEDIVQETLLEMFKIFKQLKQADHFWPWLCKIALNKIRNHSQTQSRHQQLLKDHVSELTSKSPQLDGLATVINEEFKQCIFQAMYALSDRQKTVLSMRCYENMSYAQIADVMGMSELACRLLFIRAKKKLQSKLFALGYGQKSILLALVLFGKLTASSEAAAAQICVTPTVLGAGGIAAGIALVTSKTVLTLAAGGAVVGGAVMMVNHASDSPAAEPALTAFSTVTASNNASKASSHINDGYFLFPQGKQGPVMTRLVIHEGDNIIHALQNDVGNYYYDVSQQSVILENYHYWKPDLSVMTLPTDSLAMDAFLARAENRVPKIRTVKTDSLNLFVAVSDGQERQTIPFGVHNYNALMEERFQYNWLAKMKITDNRDSLHQQGSCYFRIQGQLRGKTVSGAGGIPFVYGDALKKPAWMKVSIADTITLVDLPEGAAILDADGYCVSSYAAGTFLAGMNKPWFGLHVIDTLRRDAAQSAIPFETDLDTDGVKGVIRLKLSRATIEYAIDMKKDLIDQVSFLDLDNNKIGELSFDYLNPKDSGGALFRMPQAPAGIGSSKTESLYWPAALAQEQLLPE